MAVTYTDLYSGYSGGIPPFDQSFLVWGATPGATTTAVVHKGELIVDLIDASERKVAWRGIAKENLSESKKKLVKQVNTAVEKMFQKYPVSRIDR
jgi:KaiC/GvpD/RAD55 family RecA-like ATPase